jgi:hypothetical protein
MTSQNCVVKVRCDGGKKHQLIAHIGFCDLHGLWLWLWAFLSICNILLEFNTVHAKKIYNSDNSVFVLEHDGTLKPVVNDAFRTVPYQEESHTTSSSSFHHPFLIKCSQGWPHGCDGSSLILFKCFVTIQSLFIRSQFVHTEPTRPQDYPHRSFLFICWRVSVVSTNEEVNMIPTGLLGRLSTRRHILDPRSHIGPQVTTDIFPRHTFSNPYLTSSWKGTLCSSTVVSCCLFGCNLWSWYIL